MCTEQFADAFGRPRVTKERDGVVVADVSYHALSVDTSDALDLAGPLPSTGTPSTERKDGHGRTIESLLRNRQPGPPLATLEIYRMVTSYRADNAVLSVTRAQTTSDAPLTESQVAAAAVPGPSGRPRMLTRTFTYDSQGRRLGTTDPDSDSREASRTAANRTWRYLYNRVGDLAAVRDPRGCGQDFYYDYAGRLVAEDYIGCGESQLLGDDSDELLPSGAIGLGVMTTSPPVDVRYFFDVAPWYYSTMSGPSVSPAPPAVDYPRGRLTGTSDRGQRASVRYDARGQVSWTGRQMALLPDAAAVPGQLTDPPAAAAEGPLTSGLRSFDEAHTYALSPEYDHLGRQVAMTLPLDPDWETLGGTGPAPSVRGKVRLGRRGLPERMDVRLGGASYTILDHARYWPDGQPHVMYWGDSLGTATLPGARLYQVWTYDTRLRLHHNYLIHTPLVTPLPGETPLDGVRLIQNQYYVWDKANNLSTTRDVRERGAWALGHQGRYSIIKHDALYRVISVRNFYTKSPGWQTYDPASDWRTTRDATRSADPMRTNPATMLPTPPPDRAVDLVYEYDWLGNMVEWTDDAGAFYERSLGAQGQIGNGFDDPAYVASLPRPGALYFSSNVRDFDGTADVLVDRGGWLDVSYGEGGNATGLTVRARCHDADSMTSCWDDTTQDYASRAAQLRTRCVCAEEQHYEYRWDELNRLSEARRYDRHGAGMWQLGVRQRMRYDGANQRTVKVVSDDADVATGGALPERATLYIYPGDYERRGVVRDPIRGTYEASLALGTESQYLVGGARITWKHGTPAAGIDRDARIGMTFTDMLGSSTAVVDLVSGSLMEAGMYYPSGARETRVVNQTATFSLEPTGFTGKEEDEEVGLTYFGERYLIPRLARWASPDPLQVHAMGGGEAMNSYHYVAGNLLQATDPDGLDWTESDQQEFDRANAPSHRQTSNGGTVHSNAEARDLRRRRSVEVSRIVQAGMDIGDADRLAAYMNRVQARVTPEAAAGQGIAWDEEASMYVRARSLPDLGDMSGFSGASGVSVGLGARERDRGVVDVAMTPRRSAAIGRGGTFPRHRRSRSQPQAAIGEKRTGTMFGFLLAAAEIDPNVPVSLDMPPASPTLGRRSYPHEPQKSRFSVDEIAAAFTAGYNRSALDLRLARVAEFVVTEGVLIWAASARLPRRAMPRCLAPGTLVLMADGSLLPIEDVLPGDFVMSDDPNDEFVPSSQMVVAVHRSATYRLFNIKLRRGNDLGSITATSRHPFWTGRGWIAAESLLVNEILLDESGVEVIILSVSEESIDSPTYNLSVQDYSTFSVSDGLVAVLVHNLDPMDIAYSREVGEAETFQHGPWRGRSVEEAVIEARARGRLPDGLELNVARVRRGGDEVLAAINNRTLYVAQQAGIANVNPVNNMDSAAAAGRLESQLALARDKGGSGDFLWRCR